jgi:Tol biopolymer transport system component
MQIWRMRVDGSEQEQVVSDSYNDWFPHISPDGGWIVYLSYEKNVEGHPEANDVTLHLMSLRDKNVRPLATLLGGEGTIDAPSWSPDSSKIAFVSYAFVPLDSTKKPR